MTLCDTIHVYLHFYHPYHNVSYVLIFVTLTPMQVTMQLLTRYFFCMRLDFVHGHKFTAWTIRLFRPLGAEEGALYPGAERR